MIQKKKIAIIGGGPAGLTAAYVLAKTGHDVTVYEKDQKYVGGISRTETYKGYYFDIGGHRFFSKSQQVEDFWTEILGDDMLERPRSSRIFYKQQFFSYPLKPIEAMKQLGIAETFNCVVSYLKARLLPIKYPQNFEEWVTNQFGNRLFEIFFKTYTEKVWGIPTHAISADWAAQRIKGLSLFSAAKNAFFKPTHSKDSIKTLIDTFRYPKFGPGMMWEKCTQKIIAFGGNVILNSKVTSISYNSKTWELELANGKKVVNFDHVISSAPIRDLVPNIKPAVPATVLKAANALSYRDFITVVLILPDNNSFTDNWIYIHDPSVKVGRIQNFKSWSPYMVPDDKMICYGLEYFCFTGDGLWNSPDEVLIEMAKDELEKIGLGQKSSITDGCVVRQPKAYPVYDNHYKQHLNVVRKELDKYPGLYLVGRNGMHKYNNQDHSMMTALLAAKNIDAGKELFDVWNVNGDAEYHEKGERGDEGGRMVPLPIE